MDTCTREGIRLSFHVIDTTMRIWRLDEIYSFRFMLIVINGRQILPVSSRYERQPSQHVPSLISVSKEQLLV